MLTDIVEAIDDRSARGIAAAIGRMVTSGGLAHRCPPADGAVAVAGPRRVADDGERGVADAGRGRCDRGPRAARDLRRPARRPRRAAPLPPRHGGARSLRARPVDGHARPGAAARPRPGGGPRQPSVAHEQLPRPAGSARARCGAARAVAVPARGPHGRRRRDGRPRPRRPGRGAARRPGRRRAPDVPTPARPPRAARRGGDRGRPRRRRDDRRRAPSGAADATRRRCSCSRAPTTPRASRCRDGRAKAWRACSPRPPVSSSSRTTTAATSPRAALVSLGSWLPDRTVHIRSFSKSHGPDLRLAAIGGAGEVVAAVANRRLLGPGWSSRILQAVLVDLLADPATADVLDHARAEYAPPPAPRRRGARASRRARRRPATASTCGCASPTSARP